MLSETKPGAPEVPAERLIATLRDLAAEAEQRGLAAAAQELRQMAARLEAEQARPGPAAT
jgi:hypothetical protein